MAQPRIFISHASPDAPFANRLADDLRAAGADAWLDSSHMASGDFVARINNALANRDLVVLVLSPAAIQSSWVSQEFNTAIARTQQGLMRPPIVMMARPCRVADIPPLWTVYHRYDASNDYVGALHGVARELGLNTPTPALTAATTIPHPGRAARTPRSPGVRWSPSYLKTAIAAGIALVCLIWYQASHLLHTAPTWFGAPLFLALILGVGSWLVAVYEMARLKHWIWVGLLLIGVLSVGVLGAASSSASDTLGFYGFIEGNNGGAELASYLLPAIILAVALFGPTASRKIA